MTKSLTICLGKTGDILTILPILKRESTETQKSALMVSKDFASVLEGVSYVEPIVFDGGAHELDRAVKEAEGLSPNLRVSQVCGPMGEIRRHVLDRNQEIHEGKFLGDSFQKSLWQLLGYWPEFVKGWPLTFDRRSPEREADLLDRYFNVESKSGVRSAPKTKTILVSTGRQPKTATNEDHFSMKPLLMLVLRLAFKKGWRIVDLDEIVAERFYDLLGLYEKASLLVATDNAPLHLAYAAPTLPVCALISDKPKLWNGSAWRPNHIFHCRYGDFADRCAEMIDAIEALGMRGDWFWEQKMTGPKRVHVWSQYEVNEVNRERHLRASQNWRNRYHTEGGWISCKIDKGAFGNDTVTAELEGGRFPFVKDVLRAAAQRAGSDDLIVLTRADTCFGEQPIMPGYAHRLLRDDKGDMHSPWIDMICFPVSTLERMGELPPLVMGPDPYWSDVVKEWSGMPEMPDAVWKENDLVKPK